MPELGGDYALDTILEEMQRAGYSGTEIGNKFPKDSSSIKKFYQNINLNWLQLGILHFFYQRQSMMNLKKFTKKPPYYRRVELLSLT